MWKYVIEDATHIKPSIPWGSMQRLFLEVGESWIRLIIIDSCILMLRQMIVISLSHILRLVIAASLKVISLLRFRRRLIGVSLLRSWNLIRLSGLV